MVSSPYFTSMHHEDIHGYYLALKKFFEVTEAKHDRSNSPRAQKARAKLLKLSSSQFYELSTDVYDELQRRVNEDHVQPEYLLPKASFHIKRNQARQKLANLSQTRFNDLVDDILFEIKRRGYDSYDDKYKQVDNQENMIKKGADIFNAALTETSHTLIPPTTAVQTSQVIPKKASIDWSSDEEDIEKNLKIDTGLLISENNVDRGARPENSILKSTGESPSPVEKNDLHFGAHGDSQQISTPVTKTVTDNYQFMDPNDTPGESGVKKREEEKRFNISPLITHDKADLNINPLMTHDRADQNISPFKAHVKTDLNTGPLVANEKKAGSSSLVNGILGKALSTPKEVDQSSESLAAINKRLTDENTVLISKLAESESMVSSLKVQTTETDATKSSMPNSSYQKELSSLSSQVSALSIENENLKQQLSEMEFRSKHASSTKIDTSGSVDVLRNLDRIEERYALDEKSISKYVSEDGSIPLDCAVKLNSLIVLLYASLQQEKEDVGKELFENLSLLSHEIGQILLLVDIPDFKDEVILLRASLSHTITAVRYYSVFSSLLPRITVQAAISELAFSICGLFGSGKIKIGDTSKANFDKSKLELNHETSDSQSLRKSPQLRSAKEITQKPGEVSGFAGDAADEMSPVKPLKITQRANMSPNSTASSSRKPSGNLLFSMIDRKSPLSSTNSSKVNFKFPTTASKGAGLDAGNEIKHSANSNGKYKDEGNSDRLKFELGTPSKLHSDKQSINSNTPPSVSSLNTPKHQQETPTNYAINTPIDTPTKISDRSDVKAMGSLVSPSTVTYDEADKSPEIVSNTTLDLKSISKNGKSDLAISALSGRSFTDKLNSFNKGTGIGLRVEKAQNGIENSHLSTAQTTVYSAQSNQAKNIGPPHESSRTSKEPPLITVEKDSSPSKLTEKLRKTFEDISDDESDDENGFNNSGNLNNSSNLSDDADTYLELKKSLKKNDSATEPHIIKKATVFSPRALQNDQFNTEPTSDSDLGSQGSKSSPPSTSKDIATVAHAPPSKQLEVSPMQILPNRAEDSLPDDKGKVPNKVNEYENEEQIDCSDDYSDYQFVPLKKENNEAGSSPKLSEEKSEIPKQSAEGHQERGYDEGPELDFDVDAFDIENPDNTLSELLLYLEHQTVEVISTIQSLLSSIKEPHATKGNLREESNAINQVVNQMVDATSISMNQSRNASLKEHGNWVVKSLEDCSLRMLTLCQLNRDNKVNTLKGDGEFADKNFKQRLAGIAFDVAKCTKELVKTVEEASLKEEIAYLNSRLQ